MHFTSYLVGLCLPIALAHAAVARVEPIEPKAEPQLPGLRYGHCYIISSIDRGTELGARWYSDPYYRYGDPSHDHTLQVCRSHRDCGRSKGTYLKEDDSWYFLDRRGTAVSGAPAWLGQVSAYVASIDKSQSSDAVQFTFGEPYSPEDYRMCFKPNKPNSGLFINGDYGMQFEGTGKCIDVVFMEAPCRFLPQQKHWVGAGHSEDML
ncbi:hypothetical protein BDV25DRAFT_137317 [Aspergillus avenaceus]|uniref:Uncharacterized protein n=1 Tax=Aspergillus avenaceus TaxID=36643 RepID=A0A5N6U3D7_ASPAV|nr:hypothetical protein BDV25DRAFT_137317 [Aspergillus avenaceus]